MYVIINFCPTDAQAFSNAYFGQGSGPIYLDNVACGTTENRLINCSFDMNTAEDTHAEDAGVRCSRTRKWIKIFQVAYSWYPYYSCIISLWRKH